MALTDQLIAYWPLSNTSDVVGGRTLTNNNGVTFTSGKIANAATFTTNQTLSRATETIGVANIWTVSFWIKPISITGDMNLPRWFSLNDFNNIIPTSSSNYLRVQIRGSAGSYKDYTATSNEMITNEWNHNLITWDGSTLNLYTNGILQAVNKVLDDSVTQIDSSRVLDMGGDPSSQIDELGYWSRVLTTTEISQIFNSGRALAYPLTTPTLYGGVAYWKFNESSGDATDSISSFVLTNNNTVGYATGKIANAGDYGSTNTNKYFSLANTLGIDGGSITHNFWVKITTAPTSGNAVGLTQQYNVSNKINQRVYYKNDGGTLNLYFNRLIAGVSNEGPTVTQTLTIGTWYMVTYTYDGTNVKGYVNATEIGSASGGSGNGTDPSYFSGIIVGSMNGSPPTDVLKGLLDEYGLWNRALSSTEITTLYNSGNGLTYPFTVSTSNIKSYNTNLQANIKTIDTNPIANVKTLNTNTNT